MVTGNFISRSFMIALVFVATLVSGCSNSKNRIFRLNDQRYVKVHKHSNKQLIVRDLVVKRSLDKNKVAVVYGNSEIAYYPGIEWSDNIPTLIKDALVEKIEMSKVFAAVGLVGQNIRNDYDLLVTVKKFQLSVSNSSIAADVEIKVKILDYKTGKVIGNKNFFNHTNMKHDDVDNAIWALNKSLSVVANNMVVWLSRITL